MLTTAGPEATTSYRTSKPGRRAITTARIRSLAYVGTLLSLFLGSAELTARVQDWIVAGTAVTAVPSWDGDLFVDAPEGRRGRPNGRYLKWVLNEFGFRSGPMRTAPGGDRSRLMFLGSSETFGLYESPGHEFPALAAERLKTRFEVVNAGLTGMTLGSTIPYWTAWASRFSPDVVIVYPSPFFYLNEGVLPRDAAKASEAPGGARPAARAPAWDVRFIDALTGMRLMLRARDRLDVPDVVQRWRDERTIRLATAGRPSGWLFESVPHERVEIFIRDLEGLVTAIQQRGARAIVMTHVSRVVDPPTEEDMKWLERARVNTPRATAPVIARFEAATNAALVEWAARRGVEVIDLRPSLGGRDQFFGDLIHFNDDGAGVVAESIATYLARPGGLERPQGSLSMMSDAVQ